MWVLCWCLLNMEQLLSLGLTSGSGASCQGPLTPSLLHTEGLWEGCYPPHLMFHSDIFTVVVGSSSSWYRPLRVTRVLWDGSQRGGGSFHSASEQHILSGRSQTGASSRRVFGCSVLHREQAYANSTTAKTFSYFPTE